VLPFVLLALFLPREDDAAAHVSDVAHAEPGEAAP